MSKPRIPIIDMGHGYVINNLYQTAGKRSPDYGKGVIYEGVSNKHFGNDLMAELFKANIPFYICNPEPEDISLAERTRRANNRYAANKETYLLSIHSNAGGGTGIEGFTSIGQTASDLICEDFLIGLQTDLPGVKYRFDNSDGDRDKEIDFYILKNTTCPSILLELLFMDNMGDYCLLFDDDFRKSIVQSLKKTIIKRYNAK